MARIPQWTGNHSWFHVGMIKPSLPTLPTFPNYLTYLTYLPNLFNTQGTGVKTSPPLYFWAETFMFILYVTKNVIFPIHYPYRGDFFCNFTFVQKAWGHLTWGLPLVSPLNSDEKMVLVRKKKLLPLTHPLTSGEVHITETGDRENNSGRILYMFNTGVGAMERIQLHPRSSWAYCALGASDFDAQMSGIKI